MTLGEAALIFESWRETPPTHHMMQVLARLWGWQGPARDRRSEIGDQTTRPPISDLRSLAAIPGMTHRPVGEGLPAVVLDFEALKRSYRR
jgi:hypothetical protein